MVLNTANSKSARLTRDILKDFRVLAKLTSFSNQIKAWSEDATNALDPDLSAYGISKG